MERRHGSRGIRFDGTINLGNIIALIVLLGALFSAWDNVDNRLAIVETKIDPVWKVFANTGRGE